jgi:hypothetical protein
MPSFSLKSLLLSTTLISIGAGMLWVVFHYPPNLGMLLYWLGGGVLIGAGVCTPIRQPFLGGLLGLVVQIIAFGLTFDH